jgi:hypothetical protein
LGVKAEMEITMDTQSNDVTVVNIKMPFWSMVIFMVKWAIASIPAILILVVLGAMLVGFLNGLFGSLGR